MNLKPKNYKTLAWVTIFLIFVTPLIENFLLGLSLSLVAVFFLAMGMHSNNKGNK